MEFSQVPIASHPLLGLMYGAIANLPSMRVSNTCSVQEARRLAMRQCPYKITPSAGETIHIDRGVRAALPLDVKHGAAWYLPPWGAVGWHTNEDAPGWRVYVIRGEGGVFRTPSVDYPDRPGYANVFLVTVSPLTWHAVVPRGDRWSFGVKVPESLAREILGGRDELPIQDAPRPPV